MLWRPVQRRQRRGCSNPRRSHPRDRRAADHDLHLVAQAGFTQCVDYVLLSVHGGREKRGEADNLYVVIADRLHNAGGIHVYTKIDTFDSLSLDHDLHEILADVVHIALDGADHGFSDRLDPFSGQSRLQGLHPPVHRPCGNKDFRHEYLVVLEFFTDDVHTGDKSLVENGLRRDPIGKCFGDKRDDFLCTTCLHLFRDGLTNRHIVVSFLAESAANGCDGTIPDSPRTAVWIENGMARFVPIVS